jgi:large subunit ribosomal protein L30
MADVEITQVRSANGASPAQRDTLRSLKLGKIGRSASYKDSPQLQGMLRVVEHMVEVGADQGAQSKGASNRHPRSRRRGGAG